ncbi:MAG TPA: non-ribosomal peptide synthase/polyketide synthase [Thermoanaerobaculia bacterium]|nr:non-ribosomal peptide synthase/polyketide synthase [Thermoanaerobaculia bacterium]
MLGRTDHQVKIRGFRIELGEIEAALLAQPGIREAVAVVREDRPGDRRLVAYVAGDAVESSALRERLGDRLPAVMVPAVFVALNSLPKNPNGKVDRRALPAPEEPGPAKPGAAPRDPFEEVIAGLWAELLGRPRVGVDESFFALGGHSLLAMRLASRLREVFGVELRVRALFEGPTVAELARRVREAVHAGAGSELPPIRPVPRDGELPLSFAQQRLWFLWHLEPESPAYNLTGALRIEGPLDVAAAGRTLSEIVRRHEVLRTTFPAEAGRPVQRIGPASELALAVEDLSALPAPEERAREAFRAEARRPFDLAREAPLRARLLRLGPGDHVLLLNLHHIASDAWSMGLLEREVTALYEAFAGGRPSPLPELPVQYADFAQWQREWLQGEVLERQLAYWRGQLAGAPPVLDLPLDRPRPPVASPRGERLAFPLPAALSRSLAELGRQRSLTPFMVLLAGLQALLARLSGQTDVSVGTPIAGRRHVATEELIGFFVNTLVLRGHLDRARTFEDLLGQARDVALSAYTHQDLPFERLVDELSPERSLGHTPLFQVMLILQNVERSGLHAAGLELSPFGGEPGVAKFDLLLSLTEEDGAIRGELDFRTGLFDRTTAVRLAGHLVSLLESAVSAPETLWADLAFLSPAERHQMVAEWNDTDASGAGEATLHGLVEAQAERTPEAVAVTFGEESLSYAELDRRAGWLAWRLRRLGVGPEVRVGICAERSLELVVGLLGILKAGGAYVPLDPDHPDARLALVIEDARPPVVLTQDSLGERLQGLLDANAGGLGLAAASAGEGPAPRLRGGAGADHAAYVMFTSGSTGRPKGVVNTHRGIVNRLLWMQGFRGLTAGDRVLQKTPFGFDVSVAEIFGPLLAGARLVIARPGGHQDSAYLARTIAESGITQVHFVPSMLRVFLEEPEVDAVSGLRRVIASGEALPPDLARRFHERLGGRGVELHNLYGPTEAAVEVTFHACRPGEERVPIGRPVARTRIRLLDRDGGPVPAGVAGELHIGGVQVARGYLGRPDLTAERFVPDPWGEAGARLYRTGDLARHLPDGEVEYLGRIDHQVKVRGVRIELGEIEAALLAEPGIREAVVVVREDRPGDRRLVAYVAGDAVESSALRERLGERLPSSMVPALFVALDSLPLGPSGKVDRRALPAPGAERPEARAGLAAPETPAEWTLAAIWSQVLGIERVGRHDDFFALGGDSVLSIQVVARAREAGLRLTPRQLFQHSTVAGLAAVAGPVGPVGSEGDPAAGPASWPPVPEDRPDLEEIYPLSPMQEGMLFHSLHELPGSGLYVQQSRYDLEGLDVRAFAEAWEALIARQPVLRTGFPAWESGPPVQEVHRAAPLPLCQEDWRHLSAGERQAGLQDLARSERRAGFDLARPPLLRLVLVRVSESGFHLIWTQHHVLMDGWSVPLLLGELLRLYRAAVEGRPAELLPVRPYRDYIAFLERRGDRARAEELWRRTLAGFEAPTPLPGERRTGPSGGAAAPAWGQDRILWPPAALSGLEAFARRHRLTVSTLVHGAWALLLGRSSGSGDVVFGSVTSGRPAELPGVETTVGLFINTLPVRVKMPAGLAVLPWLRSLQADQTALREVEHTPLREVQRWSGLPAGTPLFESLLIFENYPVDEGLGRDLGGLEIRPVETSMRTNYPLNLEAMASGGLSLRLEHDVRRFDPVDIRRAKGHLEQLLRGLFEDAERPLADVPWLSEGERHQILREWNETGALPPGDASVVARFERVAERMPDRPALSQDGRRFTYGELDRWSNRLARALRRRGVGAETRVAVLAERSPELIVALLGILKAGGVYVPLDPEYPRDRLDFMLEDSGAAVLLTRSDVAGALDGEGGERLPAGPDPGQLAYVIYTSGSTGRPKGVMVSHGALARLAEALGPVLRVEAGERVLQFCSPSFDASLQEIVSALTAGGDLVLRTDAMLESAGAFLATCQRESISVLTLPAAYWHELVAKMDAEGLALPPGLRRVFIGGERALPERVAAWHRHAPEGPRLINGYGVTESTVLSTAGLATPAAPGREVSAGRVLAHTEAYVLDSQGRPVPAGVAGELHLGGDLLARGYLNRPGLTAERFVPHPFPPAPGARLYRTGDRARAFPNGEIELLGRGDHQVKVRGVRIELGEIEAALRAEPGIREAVAVVREDRPGDPRLVAYVAGDASRSPDLRERLGTRLPAAMIPSQVVWLDALPLSAHGKIDRRSLPSPHSGETAAGRAVAPRTPTEEALVDAFAEVLGIARPGVEAGFFELGGHSLLATRLMSRVRGLFRVDLPLRALFDHPTAAALGRRIEAALAAGAGVEAPPLRPRPRHGPLPLSFAQQRLWFLHQLEPESPAYNQPSALRIRGPLNTAALGRTLTEIMRRHEVLRTTFPAVNGEAVQQIGPAGPLPLALVDFRALPAAVREMRARHTLSESARRPFDLALEGPVRALLFCLGERDHVLLLTLHHIASDAWSVSVLQREVIALYDAFAAGRPSPLPELPVQYADFAQWQRQWLQGEVLERQLAYWRKQLAGAPPVLDLPLDRPRPPVAGSRGGSLPLLLAPPLAGAVEELARRRSLTPFMILLAGFQLLLARSSGQPDVSVGTPIAGRRHLETEGLIGFFVNTLVMRCAVDEERTFEELLGRVREMALEAYAHQDLPFERLVQEIAPERSLQHTPLFQVLFVLQNVERGGVEIAGLEISAFGADPGVAKLDLLLTLTDQAGGLRGSLEYRTELFDRTTLARLAGHLVRLLDGAARAPRAPLSALVLLTEAERHQLLAECNDTAAAKGEEIPLHARFEAQARQSPKAVAVVSRERSLSYAELDRRAERLARRLRGLGVGPEVRVGLCAERSPEMVAGLLGILKAGGAYVPLDPGYPRERLAFLLEDSGAALVVGGASALGRLPAGARVVPLEDEEPGGPGEAGKGAGAPVSPDHLAYLIYTSGSTGRPKGVAIEHRSAAALLAWAQEAFSDEEVSAVFAATSIGFDLSVFEIFVPLSRGGRVILGADALDLPDLPCASEVTLINTVPSAVSELLRMNAVPPSVRVINLAGEPLRRALVDRIAALGTGARVLNLYGPSEDTTYSTWARVSPDGSSAHVLDSRGRPVPIGVAGELALGGTGLARGYLGRPELTAERFVPDPFGGGPGERLYLTGDRVRRLQDGELEFLGRLDHQVKVRGFRIEPGEIEAALLAQPGIREAVVVVREDRPGDRRLVAYVAGEEPEGADDLRERLREKLPAPLVPSLFVRLDALPLTPNGKVDRGALPAPDPVRSGLRSGFAAPGTPAERSLAAIWSQVLGVEPIGLHDDFFELGGDSILSLQVVARAGQAGLRLTPRQLFQNPTVAGLAAVAGQAATPWAEQGPVTGPVPLTPIQRWLFEQPSPVVDHFNQAVLLELRRPLPPALLATAALDLLAHHDALRLRFVHGSSGWSQEIAGLPGEPPFHRIDLSALPEGLRRGALESAAGGVQASLCLATGPLVRFALFHPGAGEPDRLLIAIHHLAVDGVSWRVLLEDLRLACEQRGRGEAVRLPAKTTSFQRWAARLEEHARSAAVRGELAFWRSAERTRVRPLPVDHPEGLGKNTAGSAASVSLALDPGETRALLQEVPKAYRTRIDEVLLAALARAFEDWTGEPVVAVDLEGHGREELGAEIDVSRTVGWFTAIYPVVLDIEGLRGPGELVRSVKEQMRRIPGRGLGHGLLLHASGDPEIAAALRALPRAQVVFNYLGQTDQVLSEDGPFAAAAESAGPAMAPSAPRPHLLELVSRIDDGRFTGSLRYSRSVHDPATVEALAAGFLRHLRGLIEHCLSPEAGGYTPSDFPLAALSQEALDRATRGDRSIEDLYPLSPIQLGMLLHTLREPGSEVYAEQLSCAFRGGIDPDALAAAWRGVVSRHSVLRTCFVWEGLAEPLQVVRREAPLSFDLRRWHDLPPEQWEERFAAFLREDRRRGFDLSRAPLIRLTLLELAPGESRFVWTTHHIVTDGWSMPILVREMFALYNAALQGRPARLAPVRPFRDAIAWLRQQDPAEAERFWRRELQGIKAPTPFDVDRWAPGPLPEGARHAEEKLRLPAETTGDLDRLARRHGLTLSTILQGTLAVLLSRYSGNADVLFGATVSGRPPQLPGVESIAGPFINTLPVRVRVSEAEEVIPWLRGLQERAAERQQFEHSPAVQPWSEVPLGLPLFEALLVVENYRHEVATVGDEDAAAPVEIRDVRAGVRTRYPLNLVAVPGAELALTVAYDAARFSAATIRRFLEHAAGVLQGLVRQPEARVADLSLLTEAEREVVTGDPRIRVLDAAGRPVPVGVSGELAVAGGEGGAEWIRTGDLARFLESGELELLGAAGQRMEIRGRRVDPRTIEPVLEEHPGVAEAVVLGIVERRELWAGVVAVPGSGLDAGALRAWAGERLPGHLVPHSIGILKAPPRSADGALDRRALLASVERSPDPVSPLPPLESTLLGLWREVLGVEDLGVDDGFLDLGGHSLLAIRLLARLREVFAVELPLRTLFDAPTVAELAPRLATLLEPGDRRRVPPVVRTSDDRGRDFAVSFAQQRLWFLDQLEPGNPFYAHLLGVRLQGRLDVPTLEATLSEVVRRHEVLRTTLPAVDGRPVQRIAPPAPVRLPRIDLSGLAEAQAEPELRKWSRQEAMRPFDLARGPLLRAVLFRLAPGEHVVLLNLHHIIFDGWSIGLLVREVAALYEALAAERPSPLPELPIQYADYAEWQRGWLQGEVLDGHLAYWKRHLAGSWKPLELPADRPRPARPSYRGASLRLLLDTDTSRGVAALSRSQGVTPFMTFLAAFDVLLARQTGEEDVVVGMALANRTRAEVEGLIGFFVNMLPLRVDLSGSPSFLDLLQRVREVCLGAQAHQDLPLDKLVEAVRPDRAAGDAPLFRIAFGLQNTPQEALELPGLALRAFGLPEETVRFDLTVWLFETGAGFSVQWAYSTERFEESTVRRLHGRFAQLLASAVERPGTEIDALEMLPAGERQERALAEKTEEASRRARLLQARPRKVGLPGAPS